MAQTHHPSSNLARFGSQGCAHDTRCAQCRKSSHLARGGSFWLGVMVSSNGALSWQEAQAICSEHAPRLVGSRVWIEATCPHCGELVLGAHTYSRADVLAFLQGAFSRQRKEPSRALSRRYWVHRAPFFSRRSRYDTLLSVLVEVGVVIDRGSRAAGIMVVAPKTALDALERWARYCGVSGVSGRSGRSGQARSLDLA